MELELGKTPDRLPIFLWSIRKPYHSGERGKFWLIAGQLYAGYAGLMLCLGYFTITLWIQKWQDSKPKLKTVFWGI
jgi:hypothetical protein